jgi:hypothetical protein
MSGVKVIPLVPQLDIFPQCHSGNIFYTPTTIFEVLAHYEEIASDGRIFYKGSVSWGVLCVCAFAFVRIFKGRRWGIERICCILGCRPWRATSGWQVHGDSVHPFDRKVLDFRHANLLLDDSTERKAIDTPSIPLK